MTRLADAEARTQSGHGGGQGGGLSIRQNRAATGVSPTRVHQLLQGDEARSDPGVRSQLYAPRPAHPAAAEADLPLRHPR